MDLGNLAYRQTTGAMKLTLAGNARSEDAAKQDIPWVFMKEISSDGDVSTVDVIYPAAPLILAQNPTIFYRLMVPIMEYAANRTADPSSGEYKYNYSLPWAPHHLGHWPVSDILPKQQENMPVEETANMLILFDYVLQTQAYYPWPDYYTDILKRWGEYLLHGGDGVLPDPGNQLCTDDFEGPSPHNSNLAAKGIIGLGAYQDILKRLGTKTPSGGQSC